MKVSVIVTTCNRPSELVRVLEGLTLQKRLPDEVIVADDGSGPETARVVTNFAEGVPFPLLHVWQEDRGFRAAKIRNEAIKKSSGDYILLLDGDCVPNRYFVADHVALEEKGFFVQGKRILVSRQASEYFNVSHANSFASSFKLAVSGLLSNSHHILRLPVFPAFKNKNLRGVKSCNMAFYKADVLAVNGYNEAFVGWGREDSELAARLYKYGLRRKEHPFMAVCFHLWHPENPRQHLKQNDEILNRTLLQEGYWCEKGIVKGPCKP